MVRVVVYSTAVVAEMSASEYCIRCPATVSIAFIPPIEAAPIEAGHFRSLSVADLGLEYASASSMDHSLQLRNPSLAPFVSPHHSLYAHPMTVKFLLIDYVGCRRLEGVFLLLQSVNLPPPCALRQVLLVVSHLFTNSSPEVDAS